MPSSTYFVIEVFNTLENTSTCCEATATLLISRSYPESLISWFFYVDKLFKHLIVLIEKYNYLYCEIKH